MSYNYEYKWRIGSTSEMSEREVFAMFKNNPAAVFPFRVDDCATFYTGAECTLKTGQQTLPGYVPVPVNSVGRVGIDVTRDEVIFTVIGLGYFDAPGSTIAFAVEESNGAIYLSQRAEGHGADFVTYLAIENFGFSKRAWEAQIDALRQLVLSQKET